MVPLSPSLFIAAAGALVGAGVANDAAPGSLFHQMLARLGQPALPGAPWSCAYVQHAGYWAHFDFGARWSSWPLPATNDPRDLRAFGEERGICVETPDEGDLFLAWSPARKQHVRVGIVLEVVETRSYPGNGREYHLCTTMEGDTTELGAPSGPGVHLVRRQLSVASRDRFLRWTALDPRHAAGNPIAASQIAMGRTVVRRAA